jgi:hypothetical protein
MRVGLIATALSRTHLPTASGIRDWFLNGDLWVCHSLGGAALEDPVWLARLRGYTLGAAALTLAASGVKPIGPLTISDLLLALAVALMLTRFGIRNAQRLWVPLAAVTLIAIGGIIGTAVVSPSEATESGEMLGRFVVAAGGALLLVICWRPDSEQVRSFAWLWVAGGVIAALVALSAGEPRPAGLTPHSTHLAIISLVLFGVSLGLISSERRWSRLIPGLAASGVLMAAIVVSGSRAALAAAGIVLLLALIATRNRWAVAMAITVTAAFAGLAVLSAVGGTPEWTPGSSRGNALERLFQERVQLGREREALRDAAWERFNSDPLTGAGFADATRPHSLLLQLGSSAGVLGVIGGLTIVGLALRGYVLAVRRRLADFSYWPMAAGLSAAVIGYLAANSFQNVNWDRTVWVAIALMTWLSATRRLRERSEPTNDELSAEDSLPSRPLSVEASGPDPQPALPAQPH